MLILIRDPTAMSGHIPLLMYHQIRTATKDEPWGKMCVAPEQFAAQMRWLKRLGYQAVAVNQVPKLLQQRASGRYVVITFDDGFLNNLEHAAPLLYELGFSATCYLLSDCLGKNNHWDLAAGVAQQPLMDVPQVKQWLDYGLQIGCHGATHRSLPALNDEELSHEICYAQAELEDQFGVPVVDFCYPYGEQDARVIDAVKRCGFQTAVGIRCDYAKAGDDPWLLPRIHMYPQTPLWRFIAEMQFAIEVKR